MSNRKNPSRVEINNKWYDVREGWAGKLELYEYTGLTITPLLFAGLWY